MAVAARHLSVVLGDALLLEEHDGDPRHRVTVRGEGGRVVGVGVLQRAYGSAAEVVLAVEDPHDGVLISGVLEGVRLRARELGLTAVQFAIAPGQRSLVAAVGGGTPTAGGVLVVGV